MIFKREVMHDSLLFLRFEFASKDKCINRFPIELEKAIVGPLIQMIDCRYNKIHTTITFNYISIKTILDVV